MESLPTTKTNSIPQIEFDKLFCENKKVLYFEGLENEHAQAQISLLVNEFAKQTDSSLIKKFHLTDWTEVFDLLTEHIKQQTLLLG